MTNLISSKDALTAWANNKEVQIWNGNIWLDIEGSCQLKVFLKTERKFRLKPRTITLNGIEVPAPFEPKEFEDCYMLTDLYEHGYTMTSWKYCKQVPAWRSEDEIKQVVAALRQVFGGCVMTEYKITSLKDLLNIPVDRIDDCLDELKDSLKLMHAQMVAFEIPVTDAVFDSFTWKDDGAKDMTSNAHFSCGGVVQVKVDRND